MDKYIYDKSIWLWYKLQGYYYIPCLTLPAEEVQTTGIREQRCLRYLKEYYRVPYLNLPTYDRRNEYLAVIDKQTKKRFVRLIER